MISVNISASQINAIQSKLDQMPRKSPLVVKNAINATAKQARKQLATEAQKTYVVKTGRFNKAMTIDQATRGKLEATVGSVGKVTEIKDYKVTPATYSTGDNRPEIVKGKVLRESNLKPLKKGDVKAFLVKFKNGHVSVAQRIASKRYPIKILYSPSIPTMLGNEETVYGKVGPDIESNLKMNLERFVSEMMEG